jgi:microcystin degradation protein MlrC
LYRNIRPCAPRSISGSARSKAIYLVLHGDTVTEEMDDVEGEVLARLRGLEGG